MSFDLFQSNSLFSRKIEKYICLSSSSTAGRSTGLPVDGSHRRVRPIRRRSAYWMLAQKPVTDQKKTIRASQLFSLSRYFISSFCFVDLGFYLGRYIESFLFSVEDRHNRETISGGLEWPTIEITSVDILQLVVQRVLCVCVSARLGRLLPLVLSA